MPEERRQNPFRRIRMRYRGRVSQIQIYLGKMLRMFLYQSDWKVLPMSAMVAGLVGLVIRKRFFATMEGTLMSALAVTCLCLWNGCFNSIQVICRERDVIKREHRSGMHISSYIAAHMIYQALLCLLQTGITLYVMRMVGVRYPTEGLVTRFFISEFSISLFLITYAADMMSLWISSLSHTTTAAMTIMPVILIVQLVFSGGMMSLPERAEPVTRAIISNYGLKLIATQANYNAQPLGSAWSTVVRMKGNEIKTTVTMGQILDFLGNPDNPYAEQIRSIKLTEDNSLLGTITVGTVVDTVNDSEYSRQLRSQTISIDTTVGDVIGMLGEKEVREYVETKATESARVSDYDYNKLNVADYWLSLIFFALVFAGLSTITLEMIDKDKR